MTGSEQTEPTSAAMDSAVAALEPSSASDAQLAISDTTINTTTITSAAQSATSTQNADSNQPLSKNALKRLRRQEKWDATKAFRKQKEKEKKKEQAARKREERMAEAAAGAAALTAANGDAESPSTGMKRKADEASSAATTQLALGNKKPRKEHFHVPLTILIDCGFDELMTDKEIVSLSSQLTRSYADNRSATHQVNLRITSLNQRLAHRFTHTLKNHHLNWKRVTFSENDYEIPEDPEEKNKIIYLTSDSDDTLETLDEGYTYIVGGIVDRNRHKGLCYKKATSQNLRTAKLPISEYIKMASRFVLTTNQVVEIMLKWLECRDWKDAFLSVIPQRKQPKAKPVGGADADGTENVGQEQGEDEEEEEDAEDVEAGGEDEAVAEKNSEVKQEFKEVATKDINVDLGQTKAGASKTEAIAESVPGASSTV